MAAGYSGKMDETIAELSRIRTSTTDLVERGVISLAIAEGLRWLGRPSEARQLIRDAYADLSREHELLPRVVFADALVEIYLGQWKQALEKLEQITKSFPAVLQDPENVDFLEEISRYRGYALVELERYSEARPLLESIAFQEYDRPTALYYLGICNFELGEPSKAKILLTEGLTLGLHPVYEVSARYHIALISNRSQQYAWAKLELEKCLKQSDSGRVPRNSIIAALAKVSTALGQHEDADRYSRMLRG
jgi:tetratricopeptide (TPR) repeat protein